MADTVFDFISQHGRVPFISDTPKPWTYKAWILPYITLHHAVLGMCSNRWGYYHGTMQGPIPQIAFKKTNNKVDSLLHEWSRLCGQDLGGWTDFRLLLEWLGWGLGVKEEPPHISDEHQSKLYQTVNIGELLKEPYDYLGEHVAQGKASRWNPTAFYPTPHHVVEFMVTMQFYDHPDGKYAKVCDPCMGSGRMLLHASNYSLCLYGQDIDPLCVLMTKINGALYAPWISFPVSEDLRATDAA